MNNLPNLTMSSTLDPFLKWFPSERIPETKTDEDPSRFMLLMFEDGMPLKGEYDHNTKKYLVFNPCYEGPLPATDTELINEQIEYELDETDEVVAWMWIPSPRL